MFRARYLFADRLCPFPEALPSLRRKRWSLCGSPLLVAAYVCKATCRLLLHQSSSLRSQWAPKNKCFHLIFFLFDSWHQQKKISKCSLKPSSVSFFFVCLTIMNQLHTLCKQLFFFNVTCPTHCFMALRVCKGLIPCFLQWLKIAVKSVSSFLRMRILSRPGFEQPPAL